MCDSDMVEGDSGLLSVEGSMGVTGTWWEGSEGRVECGVVCGCHWDVG